MSSFIKNHNYPGYETLGDVFNLSASTSFTFSPNTTLVSCSGQVGNATSYHPTSSTHAEQFSAGHTEQFTTALSNVEQALSAAQPHLTSEELWNGVYSITSYHIGLAEQEEQLEMAAVARRVMGKGGNKPAWSAIRVEGLLPEGCVVEVVVQAAYEKKA